jgi:hypothetical protein
VGVAQANHRGVRSTFDGQDYYCCLTTPGGTERWLGKGKHSNADHASRIVNDSWALGYSKAPGLRITFVIFQVVRNATLSD